MKQSKLVTIAMAVLLSAGVYAEDAHHPAGDAATAPATASAVPPKEAMGQIDRQLMDMKTMHEKMMAAKTPEERGALMAEHMKAMQGAMAMMGGMGPNGPNPMKGAMSSDPAARQQMMEKRIDMMEAMMQMMMDRMAAPAAK